MTKQEEIREGIDRIIQHWNPCASTSTDWTPLHGGLTVGQDLVNYLHSQGVVIKVDRELPEPVGVEILVGAIIHATQQDMLKAGYVAVEPLVR